MSLLQVAIIGLLGWVLIIIIHSLAVAIYKKDAADGSIMYPEAKAEMVEDGNNLFTNAVVYFIAILICYFFKVRLLHWAALAIGIAFCVPSVLSILVSLFFKWKIYKDKYLFLSLITAMINTFTPLIMISSIYFNYLK